MNALRFIEILQSYGSHPARWPDDERAAMQDFADKFDDAQALLDEQALLDAALDTQTAPAPSEFLRARIMAGAAVPNAAPKAANDRMPWRSVAAMLLVGIFTGVAAGQYTAGAEDMTGPADMLAESSYEADYDWLGETFDLDDAAGG